MVTIGLLFVKAAGDRSTVTAMLLGSDGTSVTDHMLMIIVDELRTANWMRSKDGAKNRNRPKPVSPLAKGRDKKLGTATPAPQAVAMLARYGPAPRPVPVGAPDEESGTVDSDPDEF